MKKKTATAKTKIKIQIPAKVLIITDDNEEVWHFLDGPEDLEATLMIARAHGWKVKYNGRFITD